jgi:hypothetical protein
MDFSDPIIIGLIITIIGAIGLVGGVFKTGNIEINIQTAKGRTTLIFILLTLVGLGIIIIDMVRYR